MDLRELESYRLSDAVKFNEHLNPRIWGRDEKMLPEVREQLLKIAEDFKEFLGIDLEVKDITVSGSNAAYTYTDHSDIDLHLVADLPRSDSDEVYRELFDAKKYQYNDQHNFKIGGYDVELYVQNANETPVSQGIYSLINNDWIQVPRRRRPDVNDISVKSKYMDLAHRIDAAIESGDSARMADMAKKVRDLRQSGLEKTGEFGAENLAFKVLRNNGTLDRLRQARLAAKSQEFSIDEARKRKRAKKKTRYAWGGYWTPGYNFGDTELGGGGDGGGESVQESTNTPDIAQLIKQFAAFCAEQLRMDSVPTVKIKRDPEWSRRNGSFGQYQPDNNALIVSVAERHPVDVLRTLAHELVHHKQNEIADLPDNAGETGSTYEDSANALAGRIMRDFADANSDLFDSLSINEDWRSRLGSAAAAACIAGTPGCATMTPAVKDAAQTVQTVGRAAQSIKQMGTAGAQEEIVQQIKNELRRRRGEVVPEDYSPDNPPGPESRPTMPSGTVRVDVSDMYDWYKLGQHISDLEGLGRHDFGQGPPSTIMAFGDEDLEHEYIKNLKRTGLDVTDIDPAEHRPLKGQKTDPTFNVAEASGYIPTEKEKNDPRFSMALTRDIRPGETGRQANKLGLKTDSQGKPALLMKKLNNLLESVKSGRVDEDQDLFEIDMSPSNLRKLVRDIDARAGIEFEMIVPGVRVEDEDLEPDYDTDERVDSIEEAYDFFFDGDYNSRGDVNRLKASMLENYYIWRDEQLNDQWDREGLDYLRDYIDREDLFDRDDHMEAAQEYVRELFADEDEPVDEQSERFLDAVTERLDSMADEFVESEWEDQGRIYDDAREQFDEEMGDTYDESDWLRSENIRYMSDITNFYSSDVQWPYWRSGGGDGEMDIDAVANSFEEAIDRPVNAASSYHGARREAGTYVVEPDGSLVGDDSDDGGLEFVSPPLPLDELLSDMEKVRAWAKQRGCYTNNSTGLHMNVSVPNTSTAKLDYVKLALLLGDEHVLNEFGRASNTYAGSALKKIREILKNNPNAAAEVLNKMRDHMEALATKVIHSGETQKFTSINTKGDYVEFRSPGGDWLDANWDKVTPTLLRTVVALDAAMDPTKYRKEYQKKLYKLLDSSQERLASPNVNKLLSMYFTADSEGGSREIAVQLAKELLVKRDPSRKVPEPKPADGQPVAPGSGRWGLWINGLNKFARRGDERLEFDSREAARDWYADQAMMRPGIRSDVEVREIPAEPAAAAPAQPDQGSGARTYRVFTTHNNQTVGTFQSDGIHGSTNASIAFRNYLRSIGRESAAGFNYELIGSERPQAAAQQTAAAPAADALPPMMPLDIEIERAPRTLTTPGQPQQQFTGEWKIVDASGRELHRFGGVGNVQADANRVALAWLRQNPRHMQDGVEVLPVMSE